MSRRVLIVLFDRVERLDVTGPLEVFAGANSVVSGGADGAGERAVYEISTASVGGGPVRTGSGLRIAPDLGLRDAPAPHTLIVPGGPGTRAPDPELAGWRPGRSGRAHRVGLHGAFLLARGGPAGSRSPRAPPDSIGTHG